MRTSLQKLKERNFAMLLLLLPLLVYFYFGFQHITKFETADEHYWMYSNTNNNNYWVNNNGRIQQYWSALASGELEKTRINDKPGITLAYVSGVGAFLKTNLEKGILAGTISPMSKIEKAERVNLYFRVPLLIFNGLFMFVLFYLLRKFLKSDWVALLASSLMLLSPIVVGISQIINPDSLLWEFGFAALLSFLIFLRSRSRKFVLLAALFLGLSLLTKYSSVIFFPFFLAVLVLYVIANRGKFAKEGESKKIAELSIGLYLIFFGALAVYAVFLPDNLVSYQHFLKGSVGFKGMQYFFAGIFLLNGLILADAKIFKSKAIVWFAEKTAVFEMLGSSTVILLPVTILAIVVVNTIFGRDTLGLFKVPFDASEKIFFGKNLEFKVLLRQFLPLVFSLSPIVIVAFCYASIKNIKRSSQFHWIILVSSFFMLVYVSAVTLQKVPLTIRYGIMLYPVIITLAATGIYQFISIYKSKQLFLILISTAIFFVGVGSLFMSKPFYFNYTNFLLSKKYIIADAWGYGGYEAAAYLNQVVGSRAVRVWSDYNGVCVFFNGDCSANKLTMQNIRKDAKKKGVAPEFDYFVSSRRGSNLSHDLWENLIDEYGSSSVFLLEIGGRPQNFMKVYENEGINNQKFNTN